MMLQYQVEYMWGANPSHGWVTTAAFKMLHEAHNYCYKKERRMIDRHWRIVDANTGRVHRYTKPWRGD